MPDDGPEQGNPVSHRCRWCKRSRVQLKRRGWTWFICQPCDAYSIRKRPSSPPEEQP